MTSQQEYYDRFNVFRRIQHWVLTLSFGLLVFTGLPQRYPLSFWGDFLIRLFGGIEMTRVIHRGSSIVLAIVFFIHLAELAYLLFVLKTKPSMLPGIKDGKDIIQTLRYNLGLTKKHPKLPRYNFIEKLEYWAVIWGCILMGITGFMLWNPITVTKYLPGQFIPAAKTAHSMEALLAALAIFIWHFYYAHIRIFNKSMFHGKLTRAQMEDEHAGELQEIHSGESTPAPAHDATVARRAKIFWPTSVAVLGAITVAIFLFLTGEETAIATLPPAERVAAYVPATPTDTPTPIPTRTATPTPAGLGPAESLLLPAPRIPHPQEGWEECSICHAMDSAFPVPADHQPLGLTTCLVCHSQEKVGEPANLITHPVVGWETCLMCHTSASLPSSHQDVGFTDRECLLCHAESPDLPTPAPSPTPRPAAEEPDEEGEVTFAGVILPMMQAQCASCHGAVILGGLDVRTYEAFAEGGDDGPSFVPGSPDDSLIVKVMREGHPVVFSDADLQLLIAWIEAGAENN